MESHYVKLEEQPKKPEVKKEKTKEEGKPATQYKQSTNQSGMFSASRTQTAARAPRQQSMDYYSSSSHDCDGCAEGCCIGCCIGSSLS